MVYHTIDIENDLRRRIIEEELAPGDFLVERDLSKEYNVSRTPVRESLRQLVSDGLVVLNRGRGYSVRKLTIEDLLEIFISREAIEGTLTNLAAANLDTKLRKDLIQMQHRIEEIDATTQSIKALNLGRQMHDYLANSSGNKTLLDFYHKLQNAAALTRNLSKNRAEVEVVSKEEHLRIIAAVLSGNRDAAERAMRIHLRSTCERIVASYLKGSTTSLGFLV